MLAVFLTALLLIASIVAAPSVRSERQREKEEEMIWRGKQYVRGIKMYYRKNGRYPTTLDDLTKPKLGGLRFLRQAYKDPMNKEDGTWRLIFVGPAGQLIGSTKPQQMLQLQGGVGGPGAGGFGGAASAAGGSSAFGSSFGGNGSTGSGFGSAQNGATNSQGTFGNTASAPGGAVQGAGAGTTDNGSGQNPAPVDTSNFVGGNIIGVGSKATKASIIIYEKADNYHQFEFVWDPSKDALVTGGSGTPIGAPGAAGQNPGQNPGQTPGAFGNQPTQPSSSPTPAQPETPLSPNNPQ
jgi:hypothetical protein